MYVVTGATGHTGKAVAHTLLERGQQVRVVVRDAAKGAPFKARGAEVAVADIQESAALAQALQGAKGAYLMIPPASPSSTGVLERNRQLVDGFAQAVRQSGVPRVVALSSVGAQHAEGTGIVRSLHHLEQVLGALSPSPSFSITFIRAAYFLENWASSVGAVVGSSYLPNFLAPADRKLRMVAAQDVGTVAALELLEPSGQRVVELAGPEDYSAQDIADTFERLLGTKVKLAVYPTEAMAMALQGFGYSAEYAGLMQELTAGVNSGHVRPEDLAHEVRATTSAEQFLRGLLQALKQ